MLYIQGNHLLYADRPVLAQKKFLQAKKLCEQELNNLEDQPSEDICRYLLNMDNRLPSMYARICYLLGKSYVYPLDVQHKLQFDEGEKLLSQAIQIQEYIDAYPNLFDISIDRDPFTGNTLVFKRMLGWLFLKKGQLEKADEFYVGLEKDIELANPSDPFLLRLCLKDRIRLYQQLGQKAKTEEHKKLYFQKAIACASALENTLDDTLLNRISEFYVIIADLFGDPINPFYNIELSHEYYKKANQLCPNEFKALASLSHNGLAKSFEQLANVEIQKANQDGWDYAEEASTDFLKEIDNKFERKVIVYEELGDIYREKKEWILSAIFYSNGLSLLKIIPCRKWGVDYWTK